jgi:subtilisin family serine protease
MIVVLRHASTIQQTAKLFAEHKATLSALMASQDDCQWTFYEFAPDKDQLTVHPFLAYHIKRAAGDLPEQIIGWIKQRPEVLAVEENLRFSIKPASSAVNTTKITQTNVPNWGLDRVDQRRLPLDDRFTFRSTAAGQQVNIYIVDTGIDPRHVEFLNETLPGDTLVPLRCPYTASTRVVNGFSAFPDSHGFDPNGHGTFVASQAAGWSVGVAKLANLISIQILDDQGSGSLADILAGLQFVQRQVADRQQQNGRAVVNLSFGADQSTTLNRAVEALIDRGIVVVTAAGNEDGNACRFSPGSSSGAINVGSSNSKDQLSRFSNYGKHYGVFHIIFIMMFDLAGKCVTLIAPGEDLTGAAAPSATIPPIANTNCSDFYRVDSGTSFASPLVAGAMAAIMSADPQRLGDNPRQFVANLTKFLLNSSTKGVVSRLPLFRNTPNQLIYTGDN